MDAYRAARSASGFAMVESEDFGLKSISLRAKLLLINNVERLRCSCIKRKQEHEV